MALKVACERRDHGRGTLLRLESVSEHVGVREGERERVRVCMSDSNQSGSEQSPSTHTMYVKIDRDCSLVRVCVRSCVCV